MNKLSRSRAVWPVIMTAVLAGLPGCQGNGAKRESKAPSDTVRMKTAWAIEPGMDPVADSFGEVSGVARDDRGNVYVSDFQAARIWIFDSAGHFLRSLGEKGRGPGEFQEPTGPAVGPDDRLYVRDIDRVSVFRADSAGLLTVPYQTYPGPAYPDWTSKRSTRFDSTGALLYPGQKWLADGTAVHYFIQFRPDGTMGDTVWVPRQPTAPQLTAFYQTRPGGRRLLPGLNHVPFAPLPVWDVTRSGIVISGNGRDYRLVETAEDTVPVIVFERQVTARKIPSSQRADSIEALRQRIDSLNVPRNRVKGVPDRVWNLDVPEVFPAMKAVYVAADQTVWVRRWPPDGGDRTIFDVFSRTGRYQHTVVLDRRIMVEPTPVITANTIIGAAQSRATGEWVVMQFAPASAR